MKTRLGLCAAMVGLVLFATGFGVRAGAAVGNQYIASETYYRFDVEAGEIDVRMEAELQSSSGDLEEILLWAMPGATDIVIEQDGQALEFETLNATAEDPSIVTATLQTPIRGQLRADVEMTYTVSSFDGPYTQVEPGFIETVLVSQGLGSFMLVDVPTDADNVLDPGCVLAADQPGDVKDDGYERWVCGEVVISALRTDNASVQERCARLDDRCRQRSQPLPLAAFAQSITDESRINHLTADVELREGAVPLSLKYFSGSRAWAEEQFSIAVEVLPLLEEVFGHPYPHEEVLLRQSNFIVFAGAAGVAFTESGEMLISALGQHDGHTTVHELAHQWAGLNLETAWLWEGLAEYATYRVNPHVGVEDRPLDWESYPEDDPLATWHAGSTISDPFYWYGKAGAFWQAFADEVGGHDAMTEVLGRMDDDPARRPLGGRWFMDAGEAVSGNDLDELFLEWVWDPNHATSMLADRRDAHDLADELATAAAQRGFSGIPLQVQASLADWSFGAVEEQVADARRVLAEYDALVGFAAEVGQTVPAEVGELWASTTSAGLSALIMDHRNVLELIDETATQLASTEVDNPAHGALVQARAAYDAGHPEEARELAVGAQEAALNARASAQMIAIAETEGERYKETFISRIGLVWHDPEARLVEAQRAFEAGEHVAALDYAESAFRSWNEAQSRGLQRLAMMAGLVSVLGFGGWWLLSRIDRAGDRQQGLGIREGHRIERQDPARKKKANWRDYENNP